MCSGTSPSNNGDKEGIYKIGHITRALATSTTHRVHSLHGHFFHLLPPTPGSKVQNRNPANACCKRGEGRRERNDMGPWRIGRCISESEAARTTNGAEANDRRQCACGAIIALTRASVRPFLVNISCGICGFAERGRSIGCDERADKYHMKTAAERGEPRLPRIRKTMQAACRNDSWWKNYYKLCSGTGHMWQNSLGQ